jgi:GDP-D-mannose dehydratase
MKLSWKEYVRQISWYGRPAEVDLLLWDPADAKKRLEHGAETRFANRIIIMADADLLSKQM